MPWNAGILAAIRRGVFTVCTADGVPDGSGFRSVAEALRVGLACGDYLNASDAGGLEPAALGEVLVSVGEIQTKLAVAYAEFLFRFDAQDGHEADGYATSSAWLAAMSRLSKRDAMAAVRRMQVIAKHPLLARGMAQGEISESWAREILSWLKKLPEELRDGTEKILAEAAERGRVARRPGHDHRARAGAVGGRSSRRGPRGRVPGPVPADRDHVRRGGGDPGRPDPGVRGGGDRGPGGSRQAGRAGGPAQSAGAVP